MDKSNPARCLFTSLPFLGVFMFPDEAPGHCQLWFSFGSVWSCFIRLVTDFPCLNLCNGLSRGAPNRRITYHRHLKLYFHAYKKCKSHTLYYHVWIERLSLWEQNYFFSSVIDQWRKFSNLQMRLDICYCAWISIYFSLQENWARISQLLLWF